MRKRFSSVCGQSLGKFVLCIFTGVLLVAFLALATGCRDTDALKEIIIDQNADLIDYDNPLKYYINDSTAEEESDRVSALEVSDEDPESDIIQNLIIYSSDPNTEGFTAKHSLFSAFPDFTGIEASDTVFFYYSDAVDAFEHALTPTPDVEEEQEPDTEEEEQDLTQSTTNTSTSGNTAIAGASGGTAGSSSTPDSSASGGSTGTNNTDDTSEGSSEGEGGDTGEPLPEAGNDGGGPGGEDTTPGTGGESGPWTDNTGADLFKDMSNYSVSPASWDPDEPMPQYDCVAAFGDYALIVQMIGGDGALAATDAATLENLQVNGVAVSSARVAWADASGDTSSFDPIEVVESGAKAIIVEDWEAYTYSLSYEKMDYLEANGIEWMPLTSLCNSVNIKNCVNWIGEMLQDSSVAANGSSAESRASEYCSRHDAMINVNSGLASDNDYYLNEKAKALQKTADGNDSDGLGYSGNTATHTVLINYWADDAYLNLFNMNFGAGAAYAAAGYSYTPTSFYMQAGGSINTAASRSAVAATGEIPVLQFAGSDGSNVSSYWSGNTIPGNVNYNNGSGYHALLDSGVDVAQLQNVGKGLGSDAMPKIIVTSSDIKDAIVDSSLSGNSLYHPWEYAQVGMHSGLIGISEKAYTVIGSVMTQGTVGDPNPIYPNGQIDANDILVNPQGYFCDWTSGTVESFLESGFVAAYINGSTTGYTRDQWRQDVIDFYSWAWGINPDINRIDVNSADTVN